VLLAANRDEETDRPFAGPRIHDGEVPFLAPVDEVAGGTWIGLNAAGIVVAITNRPQREVVPTHRSRGLLIMDALRAASMDRLRTALEKHLRHGASYNNFHLLAASADDALVVRFHDGWMDLIDLEPGSHLLTNHDELNDPVVPHFNTGASETMDVELARQGGLLSRHEPELPGDLPICKHEGPRGTVASTVIALPDAGVGEARFLFAPGPPCSTDFEDISPLARSLEPSE
jgi:hypothetical protein